LQPFLHELVTTLAAPCVVLSGRDGQIRAVGAQGAFVADVRVLSEAIIRTDGTEPDQVSGTRRGAGGAEFISVVRTLGDPTPDPTVWLRRRRVADVAGLTEELTVVNRSSREVSTVLSLSVATDLLELEQVKAGMSGAARRPVATAGGLRYGTDRVMVQMAFPGAQVHLEDTGAQAEWLVVIGPRAELTVSWSVSVQDKDAAVIPAAYRPEMTVPSVVADDRRLGPFVEQSVADLLALRMSVRQQPDDAFVAAGSPWYLTLFGRDSIWAARMALPLGTELAAGTLRTLAALQGSTVDPETDEQPGKILHELRRSPTTLAHTSLPPIYYGTVDATPLWVCLLADAWRWGMPSEQVRALLPAMELALAWMADYGDADGDGFLDYHDDFGRGLANQGWKDSDDSVRFADGTIAVGPVALAEVQGYAYEAALAGADLLDAFGRPGADRWRRYATELADRFRAAFWVRDDFGPFPALALDRDKRAVDAPASNMGHLLATGILSADEARLVADRLVQPSMSSGFGLRTMATTAAGYSPLSYHCGSVWPHDTAIVVHGMIKAGLVEQAVELARGLLAAGAAFDNRLPELFGGFASDDLATPVPYPASCRPQAWAAAGAVVMLQAFLGLDPDVPNGVVRLRPSTAVGALRISGLRVGGAPFEISIGTSGEVESVSAAAGTTVDSSAVPHGAASPRR
jgi:glycogen debranching enzyme